MSNSSKGPRYRCISRGTIAMILRCSLWLTDDHLLLVKSTGYSEEYQRVYLKDLKGIVAHRTKNWMTVNILLGILLTLFGLGIISTDDIYSGGSIAMLIFASPLLVLLIYNLLQGPTCKVSLLTPLGSVDLPALARSRKLSRLIQQLRPLIAAKQGSMLRSELLTRYEAERSAAVSPAQDSPSPLPASRSSVASTMGSARRWPVAPPAAIFSAGNA